MLQMPRPAFCIDLRNIHRYHKKILKSTAEALILSRLNYCCTVWGAVLNQDSIDYLQKLQNKVARLVLNYIKLLKSLGKTCMMKYAG